MNSLLAALVVLICAGTAAAQLTVYTVDPTPGYVASAPYPQILREAPLHWVNTGEERRVQYLVSRNLFLGAPVRIVDVALATRYHSTITFESISVRMAHTPAETLSTTFATNLGGGATEVLAARNYALGVAGGRWNPIGLQTPFVYYPSRGNLVIDLRVQNTQNTFEVSTWSAGQQNGTMVSAAYAIGQPASVGIDDYATKLMIAVDRADLMLTGQGCTGSGGQPLGLGFEGSAVLGQGFQIVLVDAPAGAAAALLLGLSSAPPWPLVLQPGTPACRIYQSPDVLLPITADQGGIARVPVPVANDPALVASVFFTQFVAFDPTANALGVTTSNQGRVLIGR